MIKRFIFALIFVVIVCGGIVGFNLFRAHAIKQFFAHFPHPALAVSTTVAKRVTWKPDIAAIGTLSAANGVDLTVETAGIVTHVNFKANQKVKAGQVLLSMDQEQQIADLNAEKAQAALDQQNLKRAQELANRGVGPQSTVQQMQAAALASTAQIKKLQAVLDQKTLQAPFSGTIGIPRINLGQYLTPGTTVATLQDLDTMHADFTVPEQELPNLKIGQDVRLGLTGAALTFNGKITGIDPKVDPQSRLVSVRADIANVSHKLTPGQFVQVRVELPPRPGVLAVPQTTLTTSLYGDYVYVVVPQQQANGANKPQTSSAPAVSEAKPVEDASAAENPDTKRQNKAKAGQDKDVALIAKQVFVKIGRRSDNDVEILRGVKPGDLVVTAGQNRLTNGSPVKIDNTVDPDKPLDEPQQ